MNKIKTPSSSFAHLTGDEEFTKCERKIQSYWVETEDEEIRICSKCLEAIEEKETEINGEEEEVIDEPARTVSDRPKKWRMATWEN